MAASSSDAIFATTVIYALSKRRPWVRFSHNVAHAASPQAAALDSSFWTEIERFDDPYAEIFFEKRPMLREAG